MNTEASDLNNPVGPDDECHRLDRMSVVTVFGTDSTRGRSRTEDGFNAVLALQQSDRPALTSSCHHEVGHVARYRVCLLRAEDVVASILCLTGVFPDPLIRSTADSHVPLLSILVLV
jgi:hypothetical protein